MDLNHLIYKYQYQQRAQKYSLIYFKPLKKWSYPSSIGLPFCSPAPSASDGCKNANSSTHLVSSNVTLFSPPNWVQSNAICLGSGIGLF